MDLSIRPGRQLHSQTHTSTSDIVVGGKIIVVDGWLLTADCWRVSWLIDWHLSYVASRLIVHTSSPNVYNPMYTIHRNSTLSLNSYAEGTFGVLKYSAMLVEGCVKNLRDGCVYQALAFLPRTKLVCLSVGLSVCVCGCKRHACMHMRRHDCMHMQRLGIHDMIACICEWFNCLLVIQLSAERGTLSINTMGYLSLLAFLKI